MWTAHVQTKRTGQISVKGSASDLSLKTPSLLRPCQQCKVVETMPWVVKNFLDVVKFDVPENNGCPKHTGGL